jgi:putative ABC transport system permease protein
MSSPLLRRSSLRYLLRHPWQFGLAILGVALGVAIIVSIDLANASATRAFSLSSEAVSGRATHQVAGGPEGLPDTAFRRLILETDIPAAPVVEGYVLVPRQPGRPGRMLHLLGVDPFSERPFRPYLAGGSEGTREEGSSVNLGPLLTRPAAGLLSATTAAEMGLKPGSTFSIRSGASLKKIELIGILEPRDESTRNALADLLVMDIAAAQEVLGRVGRLDRIDLILPDGLDGDVQRAAAVIPPGAQILRSSSRTETTEEMTRAFRLNLTALSLLALVCGVFLIYNTMVFSVVQRRTLIGTLRAIGVTRGQIFALVLAEAAIVAVAGTAAGLGAGVLLARELVRLVTQTINDLYFVVTVRELAVPVAVLVKGGVLGIGATLTAALAPALEATNAPPRAVLSRSALEVRLRRVLPRVTLAGAGMLALGGVLLAIPSGGGRGLIVSFAGLFAVILGAALLAPGATVALVRLLRPVMGRLFGILGRMAAGGVVASLSRTAVAIATLVIAVSATIGIGVMIDSFRGTVVRWLDATLRSDIYLGTPSRAGGFSGGDLDPDVALRMAKLPGIERVNLLRRTELPSEDGPVRLIVLGTDLHGLSGYELKEGRPSEAWPAFQEQDAVVVSEPFSHRRDVAAGDRIRLRTAAGDREFRVAGVYYDYASDRGLVLMSRRTYLRHWPDRPLTGFSVDLKPGADVEASIRRLRAALAKEPGGEGLSIQSNRALKEVSMAIFDRTFRITSVLRLVSGLVAFIGVLSALMALQLERARELGVLRANGLTPGQVWHLVTSQTGLLGLAAGLLSLPVGLALAAIMIFVVNRRSFGWTIRMEVDPAILLGALALALGAALLAGIYPAWKMARTSPALALREE